MLQSLLRRLSLPPTLRRGYDSALEHRSSRRSSQEIEKHDGASYWPDFPTERGQASSPRVALETGTPELGRRLGPPRRGPRPLLDDEEQRHLLGGARRDLRGVDLPSLETARQGIEAGDEALYPHLVGQRRATGGRDRLSR